MTLAAALGFLLAVTPLALTPGVSFTLATQRAVSGERRAGLAVAAGTGTGTGIYLHSLLAGVGLAAVVARVAHGFTVIKIAGGVYLVAIGLITLRRSLRHGTTAKRRRLPWQGHPSYLQALVGNVLNPKAAAVYLTLAPQFLSPGSGVVLPMLTLASIHVVLTACWLISWSAVVRRGRAAFDNRRARRLVDRAGGGVLVALGVRTALAHGD